MATSINKVFIFNINNIQEDYANCLEFIKLYENKDNIDFNTRLGELLKLNSDLNILLNNFDDGRSYRYLEEPIKKSNQSQMEAEEIFAKWQTSSIRIDTNILEYLLSEGEKLHYHIRIHMEYENGVIKPGNLVHLQFLALMIERLSVMQFFKEKLFKEVTFFMVPMMSEMYPFCSNGDYNDIGISYNMISQYLCMYTRKYTGLIYCIKSSKGRIKVHSLETHSTRGCDDYFPVINIDEEMYKRLFTMENDSIDNYYDYYNNLPNKHKNKVNAKFGQSSNKNPNIAMPDFITKTAYKRILNTCPERTLDVLKFLDNQEYKPIIRFCLFAFLLNKNEDLIDTWKLTGEIENGLRQVVQNSVYYSEMHKCVFGFYLHKCENYNKQQFISNLSQIYPNVFFANENDTNLGALEIFVSDLNEKQDMLNSFEVNINNDISIFKKMGKMDLSDGHQKLLNNFQNVYIQHLFSEFEPKDKLQQEWVQFRSQDFVGHVGLSLFSITAQKCKASIKVISSKESTVRNEKNYFYKAYGNPVEINEKLNILNSRVIPGTQFSILIPVIRWREVETSSLGQIVIENGIFEDYACYAKFLNYSSKPYLIERKHKQNNEMYVNSRKYPIQIDNKLRKLKDDIILQWYYYWKNHVDENCKQLLNNIYNYDFEKINYDSYFDEVNNIECCIKGLLMALNNQSNDSNELYLALTNLPQGFIQAFCNISSLLGVRRFPARVQLYLTEAISDENVSQPEMIMTGNTILQAMRNAYRISIEHGTNGCTYESYNRTKVICKKIGDLNFADSNSVKINISICPFDVILKVSGKDESLFERKIRHMAENELDGLSTGYKIINTHMRLGNKVHTESFYEMSYLFFRTSIANRIAFLIIYNLLKKNDFSIDIGKDTIIFYGYSSYSKPILTSLTEILRLWRKYNTNESTDNYHERVGFASYQYNLQSETKDIQMYFGLDSDCFGKVNDNNVLEIKDNIKIVQIVPISSTLTTFSKMWSEFLRHIDDKSKVIIGGNFTFFWISDESYRNDSPETYKKKHKFWIKDENKLITTVFNGLQDYGCNTVRYFTNATVNWHDPLECKLCYPDNVLDEEPLVETDATSTIPAQQIRIKQLLTNIDSIQSFDTINVPRLSALKNCIYQGHIVRRQNHYQYYVDTQRYFYNVKEDVMDWLKKMSFNRPHNNENPIMHIIFSPEHNTNVGFAQYVNTYYFGGMAEIISINVDKVYRSNFVCEHASIKKMIEYLFLSYDNENVMPVKFYFVDDTIITGETIEKANSLLHSLLPTNQKHKYGANLFCKIILLIDRLSNDTKAMYVDNIKDNFISFAHIDVPNNRTQGDSCVGCKLEKTAKMMYRKSATKLQSEYWAKKYGAYQKKSFNDLSCYDENFRKHSYHRMMIYHVIQNTVIKTCRTYKMGEAYDVLLDIMEWFICNDKGGIYGYNSLFDYDDNFDAIKDILKIICRPFISFDFKIKRQVLTLYILITEMLISSYDEVSKNLKEDKLKRKKFLTENERDKRTINLAIEIKKQLTAKNSELDFLKEYMIEGLTELGSSYILRKNSIKKIYDYINSIYNESLEKDIKEFWNRYALNVHRLLSNTKDETKELWVEYLFTTGEEFDPNREILFKTSKTEKNVELSGDFALDLDKFKELPKLYNEIVNTSSNKNAKDDFKYFVLQTFLQNTGLYYEGVEKSNDVNTSDEYFLNSWRIMLEYSSWVMGYDNEKTKNNYENKDSKEKKLFSHIKSRQEKSDRVSILKWYKELLNLLAEAEMEKYGIDSNNIDILLMTENSNNENKNDLDRFDIICERIGNHFIRLSEARYKAKNKLKEELAKTDHQLVEMGYVLSDSQSREDENDEESFCILYFDNLKFDNEKDNVLNLVRMEHVFLYMNVVRKNKESIGIRYLMRDILVYRNRLLRILEKDFYGDTFISYTHSNEEKNILSHEKAASHSASSDDAISIEIFVRKDNEFKNLYRKLDDHQKAYWLLVRNYTNNQIAKLFTRTFVDNGEGEIPPLYISSNSYYDKDEIFGQKLCVFNDLQIDTKIGNIDGRFELIQSIIDIDNQIENDAEFLISSEGYRYNLEYFKCILTDIMLSAIKFQSDYNEDFLLRIDNFMDLNYTGNFMDKKYISKCTLKIYREKCANDSDTDYLVIENPVDKLAHDLADWRYRNEIINMRLEDPLDFADGHMSLITIKRYIEHLYATDLKCSFFYDLSNDESNKNILVFKTYLPILKRKENDLNE